MSEPLSRRDFLHATTAGAAAMVTLGTTAGLGADASDPSPVPFVPAEPLPGWFDRPMRWVAAHARRKRSRPLRSAVLARLLPARARRRRLPERRRHRRLLPDGRAAAPSQRVARHERSVRHARHRLPRARDARHRAHRSARRARRGADGASGLDCRHRAPASRDRHWANPDLWVTCALGPYNFEFMDQVQREIVTQVQGGRHLREPLGRHRAIATASTASGTSRPRPDSTCRA